jgi:hypothetical protein
MAALVGAAVRLLRGDRVTLFFEPHPDIERGLAITVICTIMPGSRAGYVSIRFEHT